MSEFDRLSRLTQTNNQLLMAGKTVEQIKQIAPCFPCYVYEREAITRQINYVKQHLPRQVKLHYAIKANPMPALVCHIAQYVDGLDVASHREMMLALSTGMSADKISFAGPAKSQQELAAAIAAGVVLHVESVTELQRIALCAEVMATCAKVAIRVNPDFTLKGAGMKMSGGAKPFGIDAELCAQVIRQFNNDLIEVIGLHIFSGSQTLSEEHLSSMQRQTLALAVKICTEAELIPKQINIGGGFGIPYFSRETALDLPLICQALQCHLATLPECLAEVEIHLELGRYLVAEAGTYLCEVTDKKISRGQTFLMTNGGMHHHLANSGNFGQVVRKNYPVILANRVECSDVEQVEICGPLCTPLDIVAAKVTLPKAEIGDVIAVLQSGAYGASASPCNFLRHPEVTELLL